MSYLEQDLDYTEDDWGELERRLEFIFDHPATDGVLQLVRTSQHRDENLAEVKLVGVSEPSKWAGQEDLWVLMSQLDEDDNAPFYHTLIRAWFEEL